MPPVGSSTKSIFKIARFHIASARGALRCMAAAVRTTGGTLDGARVAIQGFGRVGMTVAEELAQAGATVIGLADDREAVANADGISVGRAIEWMREHDAVRDMPQTESMPKAELFAIDCDILVLAGLQGEVTEANADSVRAKIIAEVANGGTTPAADHVLADRGVTVIPDIICTAGSTVLNYFEWVQDMQAFFWDETQIQRELDRIVDEAMMGVQAMSSVQKVDLRSAAMMVAVSRVADATTLRCLYP